MSRNFTDCATMLSFDFCHVTEHHGLPNDWCQRPRRGQAKDACCRNLPFCGRARQGSRVRLPKEDNAQSRHQRLFVENVGKTEGNRSWRIFQIRELYLRMRKVLAPLTFVPKNNNLRLELCEIMYLSFISFFLLFLRSSKAGLLLLRTLHRRGNQTYAVLSKGRIKWFFLLGRWSF